MKVYCVFSLESPHRYHFQYKKENHLKLPQICNYGIFPGTQERARNSRGKRTISVRAIEVLLYILCTHVYFMYVCMYIYCVMKF